MENVKGKNVPLKTTWRNEIDNLTKTKISPERKIGLKQILNEDLTPFDWRKSIRRVKKKIFRIRCG